MSWRPVTEHEDQTAALEQLLEEAMGCRTVVAGMLYSTCPQTSSSSWPPATRTSPDLL